MMTKRGKKFYQDILASIQDGIVVVSENLSVLEFNQAAQKICGTSLTSALNSSLEDLFSCNVHLVDLVRKSQATGSSYIDTEFEFFQKKNLNHISLNVVISPMLDNGGKCIGTVIILRDISSLKLLEEDVARNDRLAIVGAIASTMAHEIKNPLGGIKGASQLLRYEIKEKALHEYTDVIIKEVNRIDRIVQEFLSASGPRVPTFRQVNIHKIIGDILLLQKETVEGNNITIHSNYDPSIPFIHADEEQLSQVILNIIKNAFESMKVSGDLFITTKVIIDYTIHSKKSGKHSQVLLLEFKDTGCGISKSQSKELFTPFFTTKQGGSGLGLALCNNIIQAHKGYLKVFNNEDFRGTIVQIYLPISHY